MNKKTTFAMLVACTGIAMQADVLSPDQAWQRAANAGQSRMVSETGTKAVPKLLYTEYADSQPACYVFAGQDGNGFAIVSADDVAAPVLAFNETGNFEAVNMPENLRSWLDFYAREIDYARQNALPMYMATSRANHANIAPIVKTKWDQDGPYNDLCPISEGRHTYTGCVSTALSQVMKYYNYPEKGKGNLYYTTASLKFNLKLDLDTLEFDWDNMLDTYPYATYGTPQERRAVAELMYATGVALRMDYTLEASGSSTSILPRVMIENFGYDKGTHYYYRDLCGKNEWEDMIYDNIVNYGPVLYRGSDQSNSGHAFLLDGYDNGYFHINWGWNGMSDGYYLLSSLDPVSQGIGGASVGSIGFVYGQAAVFKIAKPKADSKYYYQLYFENGYSLPTKQMSLGSSVTVDGSFYSMSNTEISGGTVGLEFIDANGKSTYARGMVLSNTPINMGYPNNSVTIPKLEPGKYKVRPAWVNSDYVQQPIAVPYYAVKEYTAEVVGNKITFTPDQLDNPAIKVDKVDVEGTSYAGKIVTTSVTFSNTTNAEFFNRVQSGLYLADAKDGSEPLYKGSVFMVDIAPGETQTYPYRTVFTNSKAGDYVLHFYDPSNKKWLDKGMPITLVAAPETKISGSNLSFVNGKDTAVRSGDVTFQFDVECESGMFDGYLYIALSKNKETYWRKTFMTPYVELIAGESGHYVCSDVLPSTFTTGSTVKAVLATTSSKSSAKVISPEFYFTIVAEDAGIGDIETDAEVVSTKLYNLQGVEMPADTDVPGHYIRVIQYANGNVSTEHVIR